MLSCGFTIKYPYVFAKQTIIHNPTVLVCVQYLITHFKTKTTKKYNFKLQVLNNSV